MRCNHWRWLWGLLPLTILAWLTVVVEQPRIEKDLTERTHKALEVAGLGWAGLEFSGRDGILAGDAYDSTEPTEALQVAQRVWGVRALDSDIAVLDRRDDYPWRAESVANGIVLMGFAPDNERRAAIIDMARAKFKDTAIEDGMELGRGAPDAEAWLAAVSFALDRLAEVKTGTVELTGLGLSVAGEARSQTTLHTTRLALTKNLPAGVTLVADKVTPPVINPFTWGLERTVTQLVLNGYVPDENLRAKLFDKAKMEFPKLAIIDRMEIASGAPENWFEAAGIVIAALKALQDGKAEVSASDVVLRGRAPDEAAAARIASELASALPQPFAAKTELTFPPPAPPTISPFTTRIERLPLSVVLSGFVPSEADRESLIAQIKKLFPDAAPVDELVIGLGAPEGWRACVLAGLDALARLGNGTAALTDRSIDVRGRTRDETVAAALPAQVRAAANRACDSKVEVALDVPPEPNLRWRAANAGEGEILLEGEVPDKATETLLVTSAQQLFSGARIVNRMAIASGQPEKWQKVAVTALQLLAKLRRGEAVLDAQQITLSGEASDTAVAAAVKDQLSHALAKGYSGTPAIEVKSAAMIWADKEAKRKAADEARRSTKEEVERRSDAEAQEDAKAEEEAAAKQPDDDQSPEAQEAARLKAEAEAGRRRAEGAAAWSAAGGKPPPAAGEERKEREAEAGRCEQRLRTAAADGTIRFRFASARLDRTSTATLDRLAEIASGCPGFRIEIVGHTDAIGPADANRDLSEARAEVVASYLAGAGVEAARMTAIGYGETRPVVPNTSAANRAKNRRIEFEVKVE